MGSLNATPSEVYPIVQAAMARLRAAQPHWQQRTVNERLRLVGKLSGLIADNPEVFWAPDAMEESSIRAYRRSPGEVLASEVLPLADACRYVARRGGRVLAKRRLSDRDAVWWMGSIGVREMREPWGVVLIIGPGNYPLLLPGVQMVQALAAGNGVLIKPAVGGSSAMERLKQFCSAASIPTELIQILPTSPSSAHAAMEIGVDKLLFTGSRKTGQLVAAASTQSLTPAALELGGNDPVFVLDEADLDRVARSLAYAMRMNAGQTCIAPRRVLATAATHAKLLPLLRAQLLAVDGPPGKMEVTTVGFATALQAVKEALAHGARIVVGGLEDFRTHTEVRPLVLADVMPSMQIARDDLFAPVLSLIEVANMEQALIAASECRYALAASIFGSPIAAGELARRVLAGCVTINDCLVPTADPRVSFGGWQASGYGVTRGLEGLRELTRLKVVCQRRGRWLPHLSTDSTKLAGMIQGLLLVQHGRSLSDRWRGIKLLIHEFRK